MASEVRCVAMTVVLPAASRTLPGHGDETTIGEEARHLSKWLRGPA